MRKEKEMAIRELVQSKRNHQISLIYMENIESVTLFIRDDEKELGAPVEVIRRRDKACNLKSLQLVFESGIRSYVLHAEESPENDVLMEILNSQRNLLLVYVDERGDIHNSRYLPNVLWDNT